MGRGRHSSPCRGGLYVRLCVCVCACIAQIPSLSDAEGKMMGAGRERQSNRAFKPPVRRREIRIFFSSLFHRGKKNTSVCCFTFLELVPLAKTPRPPRRAPKPPISGSRWGRTLDKAKRRSGHTLVNPPLPVCLPFPHHLRHTTRAEI